MKNKSFYRYLPDYVSAESNKAAALRSIYFPLCGAKSTSIKSSITPFLAGDIKFDKNHYVTKPVSTEDLRQDLRNFFVFIKDRGAFSLTDSGDEIESQVQVGQLWHKVIKTHSVWKLTLEATHVVPIGSQNIELMRVKVSNHSRKTIRITPTTVVPLFARSLGNKHDHEHVTSLLHRIEQSAEGVYVQPTMAFNEEGHTPVNDVYFVVGASGQGEKPLGTFPTAMSYLGEGGTPDVPDAVYKNKKPKRLSSKDLNGVEAVGALRFKDITLKPNGSKEFFVCVGMTKNKAQAKTILKKYNSSQKFESALESTEKFWLAKTSAVQFTTGDKNFNTWMRWVALQPILRRIFGCSFLPDHDYGKGGKGWRDIWQDLLSLILIEPENIRSTLVNNFAGVRIDGSNATIIGARSGEFIADRNAITRVWMDHGAWPLMTTDLYIQMTGDFNILLEETAYFCDQHLHRSQKQDSRWTPEQGQQQKDSAGRIVQGTVLEHLLVQNLVQFFNVGEHNIIRLESADWNDGLDMASERGESVAFTCVYGRNLFKIAKLLKDLAEKKKITQIKVAKELKILLDTLSPKPCDYNNPQAKQKLLMKNYFKAVQPNISGRRVSMNVNKVVGDLQKKAQWIFKHVEKQEWIHVKRKNKTYKWFNGYYDNKARRLEGQRDGRIWMTLTGQVFPIMSGVAGKQNIKEIIRSVKMFLRHKELGGIHLNTDFGVRNYLDLGRAFSFVYGTKENGAFFSHMIVMYAYALYSRGFAHEGAEVLKSIYRMSTDPQRAKIYPGVPEYFDLQGRGRYHFLTGAASWLMLTELTQVFGVRAEADDLVLSPKLLKDEFGSGGTAQVDCRFAGKKLVVIYENKQKLDYGKYSIQDVLLNNKPIKYHSLSNHQIRIPRRNFTRSKSKAVIKVVLGR